MAPATVERLLRHPILAGMIPFNPGNTSSKKRGHDVLREPDGLPVVREDLAVTPVGRWRAMVKALDTPTRGRAIPRAMRAKTSGVLSGLVW